MEKIILKENEYERIVSGLKEYLLRSEAKKYVMKIISFGSYVKGEATENSDIDLLVVRSNGKEAEEIIERTIYEFLINTGAPIEVLICPLEELFWIDDYFIYNILSYGKEVFSLDKETLKRTAMRGLLELSKEYFISAEDSAESGHWRLATDAVYNAIELIIKALLLKKIDDLPGSHGGLVSKFGELYVKTGEVDYSIGRGLNRVLRMINWARYKWEKKLVWTNIKRCMNFGINYKK